MRRVSVKVLWLSDGVDGESVRKIGRRVSMGGL